MFTYKKKITLLFSIFLVAIFFLSPYQKTLREKIYLKINSKEVKTIAGNFPINSQILDDAFNTKALRRMQHIDQGGPLTYFKYYPSFSRYDHCVGVWSLVKRFGGSLHEQLAALFHDVSHTAFSHVADTVFKLDPLSEASYQDNIHLWFLERSDISLFAEKYNISLDLLSPDRDEYHMLEQPLPDMCADRIEYNLHTALVFKILSKEEILDILNHLHFKTIEYQEDPKGVIKKGKKWYFDSIIHAKKFALLPLYFMKALWNSSYNIVFYKIFAKVISYSFEKDYFSKEDFIFGTDENVLNKIKNTNDLYLASTIDLLYNIFSTFQQTKDKKYDEIIYSKFRGIDPLVLTEEKNLQSKPAKRLTTIDFDFSYYFNQVKKEMEEGYKISYSKDFKKNILEHK
jgi:hypothetical protein